MQRKPLSLDEALDATRQSKSLAFAALPASEPEWQNLIRDLVAIANTAGGIMLVEMDHKGIPLRTRPNAQVIAPEEITARLPTFQDFRIQTVTKNGKQITAIIIGHAPTPIVENGIVYIRRGGKTKPADTKDLQHATEKLLKQMRRELISLVREITKA